MTEIEQLIEFIENYSLENHVFNYIVIILSHSNYNNLVDFYFDDYKNPIMHIVVPGTIQRTGTKTKTCRRLEIFFKDLLEYPDLPENLNNEIKRILVLANLEK